MLYYENLEDIIFNKHLLLNADELVIISGYIGPSPVNRLKELPLKVTVIGGMYSQGINSKLFNSLSKIKRENEQLDLIFSQIDIHSKIYLWKQKNKIIAALIGSANFSRNGLCTDFRETLADATQDTFFHLNKYLNLIKENSIEEPKKIQNKILLEYEYQKNTKNLDYNLQFQYDIPLFSYENNKPIVHEKSGLNWGLSKGHVALGDAYIRIPKQLLIENPYLIPAFEKSYISKTKKKRNSDPIEIIWDDNTVMEASLEGKQSYNNLTYPKQIASYSKNTIKIGGDRVSAKSILGRYLRKRLGVGLKDLINLETLDNYGRRTITFSLIESGVYFADFSV